MENDFQRGRGSFRKAVNAVMSLIKYEFNPIISVVNYKNKPEELNEYREKWTKKEQLFDTTYKHDILSKVEEKEKEKEKEK